MAPNVYPSAHYPIGEGRTAAGDSDMASRLFDFEAGYRFVFIIPVGVVRPPVLLLRYRLAHFLDVCGVRMTLMGIISVIAAPLRGATLRCAAPLRHDRGELYYRRLQSCLALQIWKRPQCPKALRSFLFQIEF